MKTTAPVPRAVRSPATMPAANRSTRLSRVPTLLIAVLASFLVLPRVHSHPHVKWAFVGVAAALLVWQVVLWIHARRTGRPLLVEGVPPIRQHYVQACVQSGVYAYWGFYWRPIYEQAPLIVAQLVFIFAFDALLAWSRGRIWRLTSGPVPIVLSTNLFIWFKDEWFVLQFVMITAGLLGKEFIKWRKEDRVTHIFNPSGFGLLVAAVTLIATGMTHDLTRALELATTIDHPPQIYVVLFCIGLVVQGFFAVTLMTMAAAVVTVVLNLAYTDVTGVYLFIASNLPAAGFLGLHLLMTDPSTSPRTNLGRLLFGAGYGAGYVLSYELLGVCGAPELYAKLFPVPILNLTVQVLDRFAKSGAAGRLNQRWETALTARRMNLLHMALWSAIFLTMLGTGYVQAPHPGDSIQFWKHAFAEGKHQAGRKLGLVAIDQAMRGGSPGAANELGVLVLEGQALHFEKDVSMAIAATWFSTALSSDSREAAENIEIAYLYLGRSEFAVEIESAVQALKIAVGKGATGRPVFLLGLAYETGTGVPKDRAQALQTYRRCDPGDLFAQKGVARLALAPEGTFVVLDGIEPALAKAAEAGDAESCWYLAWMYGLGRGAQRDEQRSRTMLQRASELGFVRAHAVLQQPALPPFVPPDPIEMTRPAWATACPL